MPCLLHMILIFSNIPWVWHWYMTFVSVFCDVLFAFWYNVPFLALIVTYILFKAHVGHVHICNIIHKYSCSVLSRYGVECITLALCISVLTTQYLTDMSWWLSQCRYWSVCLGFLHTLMDNVLFCSSLMSKNDMEPFGLLYCSINTEYMF